MRMAGLPRHLDHRTNKCRQRLPFLAEDELLLASVIGFRPPGGSISLPTKVTGGRILRSCDGPTQKRSAAQDFPAFARAVCPFNTDARDPKSNPSKRKSFDK
jgi:hypothetical protein